ncbi:hypothetical protein [Sinomonas sp. R1AF57]|uniref:hypothetical protein n=1 Tax=Sinomonas sp. R1AF57 TaxID=2020377 RepID=UPI0021012C10|nr:hypothetical protein [Sinomonas sp. R1AF57]
MIAWGVPFARTPSHVHCRTSSRSRAGSVHPRGIYGNDAAALSAWSKIRHSRSLSLPTGFPDARHFWTPLETEDLRIPHLGLTLLVEPLDVAIADTIHRLPFAEAVVVADALIGPRGRYGVHRSLAEMRALAADLPTLSARARTSFIPDFADAGSESVGESFSRALMWELGFEAPRLQVWITKDGRRIARVDYLWEQIRLTGEFDGLQKYLRSGELSGKSAAEVVVEEKRREDEVRAAGYGMVRWVWSDLLEPTRFAAILQRAGVPRRSR